MDISPSEVLSAAVYPIKQASVAVTISGLEELQNAGKEQMIDLLDSRIEVAEATMKNMLSAGVYSRRYRERGEGSHRITESGGHDPCHWNHRGNPQGQLHVLAEPGGDSRNQRHPDRQPSVEAAFERHASIVHENHPWKRPDVDLITADNVSYGLFWSGFTERQRYTNPASKMADWEPMAFGKADVVLDGGLEGSSPANRMYFLNCDYLFWRPHRQRDMVPLDSGRYSTNQDAMVQLLLWAGNLCSSNLKLQGVLNGS